MNAMDRIVLFETFYNPIEASIVKERLLANGIPCFLSDENSVTVNPLYNQALGGVKLRLFNRDVESARNILQDEDVQIYLNQIASNEGAEELEESKDKSEVCPNCGSRDVGYGQATKRRFGIFTMIVSFFMMVYPFSARKTHHCFNCEQEFD
jgi:hypothetical protein